LRVLSEEARVPEEETLLVGRVPLRRLLAHGLGDALHLASEFTHHETRDDGTVEVHFVDGRVEHADLLVGADGVGSRIATALAGGPTSRPTRLGGIAGRSALTADLRALVPPLLRAGPALNADLRRFPPKVRTLGASALQQAATDLLDAWHPAVRALVAAPVHTAGFFRFHAADPDADLTPWPSGSVNAIGDAVHAMPPTGGQAAAAAIRDADLLARELDAVVAGRTTGPLAVHAYERAMPAHAVPAIRTSLAPLAWRRRLAGPFVQRVARMALPALAAAHRIRHPHQ
jgi:2-polyprenyl-6-methoxyphenol hydroxylase-like FAD-dependent oxidoreductase